MSVAQQIRQDQRYARNHPCPICDGHANMAQGKGKRCAGFLSADGEYARCTREQYAGRLDLDESTTPATYLHKLRGECRCGVTHGPGPVRPPRPVQKQQQHGAATGTLRYELRDESGRLVGVHVRTEYADGRKSFRWEQHNGRGASAMPLYNLAAHLAAPAEALRIICEGEKATKALADAIAREGFTERVVALGTVTGAPAVPCDGSLRPLVSVPVALWADNDAAGRKQMAGVAARLVAMGAPGPKWIAVPNAQPKADAADYFAALGTVERMLQLVTDAAQSEPHSETPPGGEDGDALDTLNTYADWPEPMADAAYIGPVGAYVKKLAPQTEAAPEGLLVQALVAAGNAMGRHAHYAVEADHHHTNLYAVMVGGTGARKGVSWGHVRKFLGRAAAEWEQDHIVNGLSTGEGLISAVKDEEPAIPDKVALAFESEFASVFKVKGREGNTLSTVLRQAWDGDTLRTLTKNTPLRATGAHISIVGHITPDELRRVMSETDAGNGFGNRILWVCVKRARYLPEGGEEVNTNSEMAQLRDAILAANTRGRLQRDEEAKTLWRQRYRDLSSGRPGLLGAVTNRAEAQVTRLSLIYALLDRSPDIKKRHLEAALAVWDYCLASAQFIFGASLGDALAEKLDAELAKHGAEGMSRTDIYNFLSNNHSAKEIAVALGTLASQGRAEMRPVKGAAGRTTKRWYSLTYDVNNVNNELSSSATAAPDAPLNTQNTLNTYSVDADEEEL